MKVHGLSLAKLEPPLLAVDDPDAMVWTDGAVVPPAIAKRVGEWCWFRMEGVATYRFPAESPELAVACVAQPSEGSSRRTVVDGYYRIVVPLALQVYGLEALHGTAVQTPAGAVALCGPSRTGKTTLAYVLAESGNRLVADDGLVIDATTSSGPVTLRPIPFSVLLSDAVAERFGFGEIEPDDRAGDWESPTPAPAVPLAAVVMLDRVDDGEIAIRRLAKTEAYTALLGRSYSFSLTDLGRKKRMLSAYARLAGSVPVYYLTYPGGWGRLAATAAAIEELASSPPESHQQ